MSPSLICVSIDSSSYSVQSSRMLDGDDTGGVIWHPSILKKAAQYGLLLTRQNMLVDTDPGADAQMPALSEAQIALLPTYSAAEMARRVVPAEARDWLGRALLDAVLPGHASELAPVMVASAVVVEIR